jgi:hypothetical protein
MNAFIVRKISNYASDIFIIVNEQDRFMIYPLCGQWNFEPFYVIYHDPMLTYRLDVKYTNFHQEIGENSSCRVVTRNELLNFLDVSTLVHT